MSGQSKGGNRPPTPSRREIQRAARSLHQRPDWDPSRRVRETAEEAFEHLLAEARVTRAAMATTECRDCVEIRVETGDDTALCEAHLAEAMGL